MSEGEKSAFPETESSGPINRSPEHDPVYIESSGGMTYRQWLIGMALNGFASRQFQQEVPADVLAAWSIQQADAVIALLDKEKA